MDDEIGTWFLNYCWDKAFNIKVCIVITKIEPEKLCLKVFYEISKESLLNHDLEENG